MVLKLRLKFLLQSAFAWILIFIICVQFMADDGKDTRFTNRDLSRDGRQSRDVIYPSLPVPNVLHYIWTDPNIPLDFINYMCIVSAAKLQKPTKILFHTKKPLRGYWWNKLRKETPLRIIKLVDPMHIFNSTVYDLHQRKHLVKLLMLYHYGGIYMDTDVMMLRSLDPLRTYQAVISTHDEEKVFGHIIMSSQRSNFIEIWLTSYRDDFRPNDPTYNTETMPMLLASRFPHIVRREQEKLTTGLDDHGTPWKQAYITSLSKRSRDIDYTPRTIMSINNTVAAVIRHAMSLMEDTQSF